MRLTVHPIGIFLFFSLYLVCSVFWGAGECLIDVYLSIETVWRIEFQALFILTYKDTLISFHYLKSYWKLMMRCDYIISHKRR